MKCYLEFLGKSVVYVRGVGTFGVDQADRKAMAAYHKKATKATLNKEALPKLPELKRVTKLPCTEEIAKQFEKDKRFKIHRKAPVASNEGTKVPKAEAKAKPGR